MIAGENETLYAQALDLDSQYDNIFGIGRGKRNAGAAPKQNQGKFWKGLGNFYKNAGGLEGISSSVGNVVNAFKPNSYGNAGSDFQFGMPAGANASDDSPKKSGIPTGTYVIAGVAVVAIIGYLISQNKPAAQPANQPIQIPAQ